MITKQLQQRSQIYIMIGVLLILIAIGMFVFVLVTQWKMSAVS